MGVTKQQASRNRGAIIRAAQRLFRENGVAGVGLVELMAAAGFTRGGFYNHFPSKDALVEAVMATAIEEGAEDLEAAVAESEARDEDPLLAQIEWYLSDLHRADLEGGCPLSAFVGDARRVSPDARKLFANGVAANVGRFAELVRDGEPLDSTDRVVAIGIFSQLLGALLLSRAVATDDPNLADEILNSGRRQAELQLR